MANSSDTGLVIELGCFVSDLELTILKVECTVNNIAARPEADRQNMVQQTPCQHDISRLRSAHTVEFNDASSQLDNPHSHTVSSGIGQAVPGSRSESTGAGLSASGLGAMRAESNQHGDFSSIVHAYGHIQGVNQTPNHSVIQGVNGTPNHNRILSSTSSPSMSNHSTSDHSCRRRRYKELPIPTFDGDRLRWGEFKAAWHRYASIDLDSR